MEELDSLVKLAVMFCVLFCVFCFLLSKFLSSKNNPIKSYTKQMREITKKELQTVMPNEWAKTLIGLSGKKEVFAYDEVRHFCVCGTTGSGKTVALANFVKQANAMNYPLLIVDGKGDTDSGSLLDIAKTFNNRKLYVINLNDPAHSDTYNPFKNTNATVCKDMLINMSDWSEEHYKLSNERYLLKVISLLNLLEIPLSFKTIINSISVANFNALSLKAQKEEYITKEEHLSNTELSKTLGSIAENSISRFSLLAESELGAIFSDEGIDIATAMEENATILFILNPLLYSETSKLMGRLIIIDSKKAIGQQFANPKRTFFMFDEINTYASPPLIDLVNKSRSASITCILAMQSLSDLDRAVDEHFKEQVIENCNNYILLRQNSAKNAEAWANIIGTRKSVDTTYQLSKQGGVTTTTDAGTLKFTQEFIFHPNDIKSLKTGEGFFVSKDTGQKVKVKINKPF